MHLSLNRVHSFSIPRSTSPTGRLRIHTAGLEIGGCVAPVRSGVRSCVKMKGDARRAEMRNKKNERARLDIASRLVPKRRDPSKTGFTIGAREDSFNPQVR